MRNMTNAPYPAALRQQIIDEYRAGGTNIMELARKYSPSESTIGKWLTAVGIDAPNPRCFPEAMVQEGIALRQAGYSVPQIVQKIGGSVGGWNKAFKRAGCPRRWLEDKLSFKDTQFAVYLYLCGKPRAFVLQKTELHEKIFEKILHRYGGRMRCLSEARLAARDYTIDEGVFDCASPARSYWVGFLIADGTVSYAKFQKQPVVRVELQPQDIEHVHKLRNFMKSTKDVETSKQGYVSFRVVSQRLADGLASCGVYPNKTLVAETPEQFENDIDFWRGVIDGDGWITWPSGHHYPTIGVCGSLGIVAGFSRFAKMYYADSKVSVKRRTGDCYQALFSQRGGIRLLYDMYADCEVSLDRKRGLALSFLQRYLLEREDSSVFTETLPVSALPARQCVRCGAAYFPTRDAARYCSALCRDEARREADRRHKREKYKHATNV